MRLGKQGDGFNIDDVKERVAGRLDPDRGNVAVLQRARNGAEILLIDSARREVQAFRKLGEPAFNPIVKRGRRQHSSARRERR